MTSENLALGLLKNDKLLQTAVKSCKQVNKNLSDMGKELESIGQVTSVGDLPEKLAEVEEAKVQVEGQLLERVGFIFIKKTSGHEKMWIKFSRSYADTLISKCKILIDSFQRKKIVSGLQRNHCAI